MTKTKVQVSLVVVKLDDWEGLYKDGKLMYENHKIPRDYLLDICLKESAKPITRFATQKFIERMEEIGNLPKDLSDCELEEE